MPEALQVCTGAMRLVPVVKWPKDDKVECPRCTLTLKSKKVVQGRDWYMETPSHRAVGVREARSIDWSQV